MAVAVHHVVPMVVVVAGAPRFPSASTGSAAPPRLQYQLPRRGADPSALESGHGSSAPSQRAVLRFVVHKNVVLGPVFNTYIQTTREVVNQQVVLFPPFPDRRMSL